MQQSQARPLQTGECSQGGSRSLEGPRLPASHLPSPPSFWPRVWAHGAFLPGVRRAGKTAGVPDPALFPVSLVPLGKSPHL